MLDDSPSLTVVGHPPGKGLAVADGSVVNMCLTLYFRDSPGFPGTQTGKQTNSLYGHGLLKTCPRNFCIKNTNS